MIFMIHCEKINLHKHRTKRSMPNDEMEKLSPEGKKNLPKSPSQRLEDIKRETM